MKQILLLLGALFTNFLFAQDGTIDPNYNTGTGFDNSVFDSYLLSDNKQIAVGFFSNYNGTPANKIIKLNVDGSVDSSFNAGTGISTAGEYIFCINKQADGKFIIGGTFTSYNGISRNRIARINADGSLDNTFDTGSLISNNFPYKIRIQTDGKIIVVGSFTGTNSRIIRLNTDGTLDSSFVTGTGFDNTTAGIAIQTDGKIIIGGSYVTYNGTAAAGLIRLNTDGTLDPSFNVGSGADNAVNYISIQTDGKLIITGNFQNFNGTNTRILRLNTDGSTDSSFNAISGPNSNLTAMYLASNGKIYLSGNFTSYGANSRNRIVRINSDGSIDNTFLPGTALNGDAKFISEQTDGKILLLGGFTTYQGITKNRIVRIGDISLSAPTNTFNSELKVYPNPTNDIVNFDISSNGTIEVFDVVGKLIKTGTLTNGQNSINISDFNTGIYLAKITNELNQTKTIKIIKN